MNEALRRTADGHQVFPFVFSLRHRLVETLGGMGLLKVLSRHMTWARKKL